MEWEKRNGIKQNNGKEEEEEGKGMEGIDERKKKQTEIECGFFSSHSFQTPWSNFNSGVVFLFHVFDSRYSPTSRSIHIKWPRKKLSLIWFSKTMWCFCV